jgi:hypothetical protein
VSAGIVGPRGMSDGLAAGQIEGSLGRARK